MGMENRSLVCRSWNGEGVIHKGHGKNWGSGYLNLVVVTCLWAFFITHGTVHKGWILLYVNDASVKKKDKEKFLVDIQKLSAQNMELLWDVHPWLSCAHFSHPWGALYESNARSSVELLLHASLNLWKFGEDSMLPHYHSQRTIYKESTIFYKTPGSSFSWGVDY